MAEAAEIAWTRYKRARDAGHRDYVERALRHNGYYCSRQWRPEDREALAREGRPALTLNLVAPTVNVLLGEQIARRAEVTFRPRRGGDQATADVLAKVWRQIADANGLQWVESQVFADALVMDGRGYFDVRVSFEENWQGEVSIKALDPLDVVLDPDARTDDPKEWSEVFVTRWLSPEEIGETWGRAKMKRAMEMAGSGWGEGEEDLWRAEGTFGGSSSMPPSWEGAGSDDERKGVRSLRVVDRQWRKLARAATLVDPRSGEERIAPAAWTEERIAEHAERNGLLLFERDVRRVRWTVACGTVLLHDDWSPYDEFTVVPCFSFFRPGEPFGAVRALVSPQDLYNKTQSQILHIVNTSANSGWMVEENSLVGMDASDLQEQGARTGLVIEYRRNAGREPTKIPPNPVPTGLDRMAQSALALVKQISGVGDAMRGTASSEMSGVAAETQRDRGLVGTSMPLENLRKARHRLAERALALVQRFYDEERVVMVADEDDPLEPAEEMRVNARNAAGEIANDLTLGEYDVVLATAPSRDSHDEVQFAEALSLRSAGVAVPDDEIVRYSHLSRKDRIAKRMRQESGVEATPEQEEALRAQAEMEQRAAMAEIADMEAKVEKTRAETALALAKVQEALAAPEVDLAKEETKILLNERMSELRESLARLSSETQLAASANTTAAKLATQAMAGRTAERTARLSAAAKSNTKAA